MPLRGSLNIFRAYLKLRLFTNNVFSLVVFTDADWGGDLTDRKSTSGCLIFYGEGLINWSSSKQDIVARSTAEAEYISADHGCQELKWIHQLFHDLGIEVQLPTATL